MTPPGLPQPPPTGASALPAGTYDGTVVLVTGGGTGLGKSIATEFGRLGASVAVVSRDEGHRAAGVAAVEGAGGRALGVACDIRDADAVAAAFDAVEHGLGPVDHLVNNAAGNFPVPAEDMSPNAWRTVVDIVLNGTFLCSREFARRAITAGRTARSSTSGPPTPGPEGRGSPTRRRPRPGSRTWSRHSPSSGRPTASGSTAWCPGSCPTRTRWPPSPPSRASTRARTTGCRRAGSGTPGSWPGPPPTSARPTPPTSRDTHSSSTAPTGSVGTPCSPLHPDPRAARPRGLRRTRAPALSTGPRLRATNDEPRSHP